jgi:hypothetical protein
MNTNPKNNMKDYGNGIHATNDFLASIAREYLESEKRQRQANIDALNDTDAQSNSFYDSQGYGTWNISDRD